MNKKINERVERVLRRLHRIQDGARPKPSEMFMLAAELRSERDNHEDAERKLIDSWLAWIDRKFPPQ